MRTGNGLVEFHRTGYIGADMKLGVCKYRTLEYYAAVLDLNVIAENASFKNRIRLYLYISFQVLCALRKNACFHNIVIEEKILIVKSDLV